MSSGRIFLDRVARQHCPSPLHGHRQHNSSAESNGIIYHQTVVSILTVCLTKRGNPSNPLCVFRLARACGCVRDCSKAAQSCPEITPISHQSDTRMHRIRMRTTNVIEGVFVEIRRRTRPMVYFVNVASVDRIIYSIFNRSISSGETAPSKFLHKPLHITPT